MKITLKFEDKEIHLDTHTVNNTTLYKAQDLLTGYGMSVEDAKNTMRNWQKVMKRKGCQNGNLFETVQVNGRTGGTYLTKRQVLKLAGYVSYEFEDVVYEAFEYLAEGSPAQAAIVAGSVIITDELIQRVKSERELMNSLLKEHIWNIKSFHYGNFMKLVCKSATGYIPSTLTGKNGSSIEYIIESNHGAAMQALLASIKIVNRLLVSGVTDYNIIAAALDVETTKNKKNLHRVNLAA